MNRPYIFNLETTKLELHFEKSEYNSLTDEQKAKIKSNFLWSKTANAWVSRRKEPNLFYAKQIALELGFTGEERQGERLTYSEKLEHDTERAEARADRYESYANNAIKRAENLQSELNSYRGDISFFTQPIIAGHSGSQAFARARERIYNRYEKGFEEYRKSSYFKGKADIARGTATHAKLDNKGYVDRKIKECRKKIKDYTELIVQYEHYLHKAENGEPATNYKGEELTVDYLTERLNYILELVEVEQDKEAFFLNKFDELGGEQFSKENIKKGYKITVKGNRLVEVVSTGSVNVTYRNLTGGAKGMILQCTYAEIEKVVDTAVKIETHNFIIGQQFTANSWSGTEHRFLKKVFEIIKTTDKSITLKAITLDNKAIDEKPINRKPKKARDGKSWAISIDDTYGNTFFNPIEIDIVG